MLLTPAHCYAELVLYTVVCVNVQMEMLSPCRTHPLPSSLSAAQLAAQGSPTSAATKVGSQSQQRKAELFSRFDVRETSFHVYTGRIDLHLCDDASPGIPHYLCHLVISGGFNTKGRIFKRLTLL